MVIVVIVATLFGLSVLRLGVVAVPLLIVSIVVLAAAYIDELTRRIPNGLVLIGIAFVVVGIPAVAAAQPAGVATVALRVLVGIAIGGTPILFVIWLLDPSLIGGGDWKLLATCGAALGLLVPVAAVLASLVACAFQFVRFAILRERMAPFGPAIGAGLIIALVTLPAISRLTGGELG